MNFFAVGLPGQPVARYITNPAMVALDSGEVCLQVGALPDAPQMIASDGESVVALPADLTALRAQRWNEALAYRDMRQTGTCTTPSGIVQIDADSQRKIAGAALAAVIAKGAGQAFQVNWTLADNSVAALNADTMIAMGMAVTAHIVACQDAGTAVRAAIQGASDAASVAGVDITQGYPS